MTLKSFPFFLTTITYLLLGGWIILRHDNKMQRLYGGLCIATCFWQGVWAVLFSRISEPALVWRVRFGYTGLVFIPAIFYHFIIEFTGEEPRSKWLAGFYLASLLLAALIWSGHKFVDGLNYYSWWPAAKAGSLHLVFIVLIS